MRKKFLLFGLTPAVAFLVAGWVFGGWNPFSSIDPRHTTCLAAVIPSVVMHHQQEEIVQLLQNLAKETKSHVDPEATAPVKAIFSNRLDQELLRIANAFQNQDKSGEVAEPMTTAVRYFETDAPAFLESCLAVLDSAKKQCGTIDATTPEQIECLTPFSEEINTLLTQSTGIKSVK
jgi:hypothetical protein